MLVLVRFGIRISWPFAGLGIFKKRMASADATKCVGGFQTLKATLIAIGQRDIADMLFCEIVT